MSDTNNATACLPCPEFSTTLETGSTRRKQCVCLRKFFRVGPEATFTCEPCPTGTNCDEKEGLTLYSLPVKRGYYRLNKYSTDGTVTQFA